MISARAAVGGSGGCVCRWPECKLADLPCFDLWIGAALVAASAVRPTLLSAVNCLALLALLLRFGFGAVASRGAHGAHGFSALPGGLRAPEPTTGCAPLAVASLAPTQSDGNRRGGGREWTGRPAPGAADA